MMSEFPKFAGVLFVAEVERVAQFYQTIAAMQRTQADADHIVLESATWQLLIHGMAGEPPVLSPVPVREDSYLKLCFPVPSIAEARISAASLGGLIYPPEKEWAARGFRACDGYDPEGNVIQVRERAEIGE